MKTSGPKTKETLIQSALDLFQKKGISNVSVDIIAKTANVAKGSFYTHFKNRSDFLIYLHRDFHEKLKIEIKQAIENRPLGIERLWIGTETYLNYCLSNSSMKSFLFEARIEPALTKEVSSRNREFSIWIEKDFTKARWKYIRATANLYVGMIAETAILEMKSKKKLPNLRNAIQQFLRMD